MWKGEKIVLIIFIVKNSNLFPSKRNKLEKTIAVLPFKNDSQDSTNIFILNGLMSFITQNLNNIEELIVLPRRSVEKYRNSLISIPEILKDLNVNYLIDGNGYLHGNINKLTITFYICN